jgi:hypothetical protein
LVKVTFTSEVPVAVPEQKCDVMFENVLMHLCLLYMCAEARRKAAEKARLEVGLMCREIQPPL